MEAEIFEYHKEEDAESIESFHGMYVYSKLMY